MSQLCDIIESSNDVHYIGGLCSQLRPKAWLNVLRDDKGCDPDIHFILNGIFFGFKVVDVNANIASYSCKNYGSCFID